jgi:hypothetical protein
MTIKAGAKTGTATLTISTAATQLMTAASTTCSVTVSSAFNWNSATWADIQTLCKARANGTVTSSQFTSMVAIGNTKTTTLSTAVLGASSATMEVIGID